MRKNVQLRIDNPCSETGQLNRTLIPQREKRNGFIGVWRYLLSGMLLSSAVSVSAQSERVKPASAAFGAFGERLRSLSTEVRPEEQDTVGRSLPDTLRGRLVDAASGEPVVFATLSWKPSTGRTSDDMGNFYILRNELGGQHRVTIFAVGYKTLEIDVRKIWKNGKIRTISLRREENFLGDTVIVVEHVDN